MLDIGVVMKAYHVALTLKWYIVAFCNSVLSWSVSKFNSLVV